MALIIVKTRPISARTWIPRFVFQYGIQTTRLGCRRKDRWKQETCNGCFRVIRSAMISSSSSRPNIPSDLLTACITKRISTTLNSTAKIAPVGSITERIASAFNGVPAIVTPQFIAKGVCSPPRRTAQVVSVGCITERIDSASYCVTSVVSPCYIAEGICSASPYIATAIVTVCITKWISSATRISVGKIYWPCWYEKRKCKNRMWQFQCFSPFNC